MEVFPLISVIVPVYKVEPYLDRCVASIVSQTYQNLEIILVDDGSPDNCGAMCDAWAARDSRIHVIHKENGGLSDARNAGMKLASGQLIGFVDSDDWIEPDMFGLLYANMMEHDSEVSACGIRMEFEDGTPARMLTEQGMYLFNTEEALRALVEDTVLKPTVCDKLYRAELVRQIAFPVGKCHEDVFWSNQVFMRAKRVSVVDTPCYHYLQRRSSIMGAAFSLKRLDALEAHLQMIAFLRQNYPQLVYPASVPVFLFCIYAMRESLRCLSGGELETARGAILKTVEEITPLPVRKTNSLKRNLALVLAQISFEGTCKILNLLGGTT